MTFIQILYVFITVGCIFLLGVGAAVLYENILKTKEKRQQTRNCKKCHKQEKIKGRDKDGSPL